MNNTPTATAALKLKKGDTAFFYTASHQSNGNVIATIEQVTIESFGKKQGTAKRVRGDFAKRFFSPLSIGRSLFATAEDAKAHAQAEYLEIGFRHLNGTIRCAVSWLKNYGNPAAAPKVMGEAATAFASIPKLTIVTD